MTLICTICGNTLNNENVCVHDESFEIKVGQCFYIKNDNRKYHIVTILTEEKDPQVVYKFFGIHKKWWHYKLESLYAFGLCAKTGLYRSRRFSI
jgi:hypothetical protein